MCQSLLLDAMGTVVNEMNMVATLKILNLCDSFLLPL